MTATVRGTRAGFDLRDYLDGQAVFFAGTANVILQLGWPAIGYGVYESRVDSGNVMKVPRKRARTTVTYLAVALLGTDDERAHLRREVDRQHAQVRSTPESPVRYNAFSRDLQLWVGACLAYGSRDFHEALHGALPAGHEEELYRHLGRLATTLQVTEDQWPPSWAAFDEYWERGIAQVSYDDTLKAYLNGLLDLEQLGRFQQRLLGRFHRWVNTGFLPPRIRELMDLEWTTEDEARFRQLMARTGRFNRRVPRLVRNFPFNALLWDFRARRALRRPIV